MPLKYKFIFELSLEPVCFSWIRYRFPLPKLWAKTSGRSNAIRRLSHYEVVVILRSFGALCLLTLSSRFI